MDVMLEDNTKLKKKYGRPKTDFPYASSFVHPKMMKTKAVQTCAKLGQLLSSTAVQEKTMRTIQRFILV